MVAKEKFKIKNSKVPSDHSSNVSQDHILNLEASVVCASDTTKKVLTCLGCVQREIWKVKDDLKGYAVQYENITRVIVLNAGHLVPMDQPEASYHMITNFIEDKPF
ncbi:7710_t:CDS:2 [Entrophospora sp. SA101]|nr:7710_t:CDS:2 [Entrophospora sp. SA101]CAJ0837826.1 1099_t:CDS:2 [Entrophospora sp. SA101]